MGIFFLKHSSGKICFGGPFTATKSYHMRVQSEEEFMAQKTNDREISPFGDSLFSGTMQIKTFDSKATHFLSVMFMNNSLALLAERAARERKVRKNKLN